MVPDNDDPPVRQPGQDDGAAGMPDDLLPHRVTARHGDVDFVHTEDGLDSGPHRRDCTSRDAPSRPTPMPTTTETRSILRLVDVHKRFGSLLVLDGVSLEIARGRTTVILGASGTGKSVLLKHLVGLLNPDRGEVWIDDERIDHRRESDLVAIRQRFGYLFQHGALFDSMNVGSNVAFPLEQHTDFNAEKRRERVRYVLGLVGLSDLEEKMPADLSGGQQKRVALARAIVLDPDIILYDEPTTGLDPMRADTINELILKLQRELGATSIVVTHDLTSAFKVADRMVLLHEGQVHFDDDPAAFTESDDPIVRRFMLREETAS